MQVEHQSSALADAVVLPDGTFHECGVRVLLQLAALVTLDEPREFLKFGLVKV